MVLPIKKTEKKKAEHKLPISLYLSVFRWQDVEFINLNTQETEIHQIWRWCSQCFLNNQYNNGRKVFGELKKYKVRTVTGEIVERERRDVVGRSYGAKAIAEVLADARGVPISEAEVKAMLDDAISKGIAHAKVCLESDLCPTSPELYKEMGHTNRYLLLAEIPNIFTMNQKINAELKQKNSPLRIQTAIRTKIVET